MAISNSFACGINKVNDSTFNMSRLYQMWQKCFTQNEIKQTTFRHTDRISLLFFSYPLVRISCICKSSSEPRIIQIDTFVYIANNAVRYNMYNGCMQLFIPTPNECLSLHHRAHTNIDVIHLKCNFSRHISSFNKRMNKPIYSCLKIKCLQQFSRIVVSTSLSFLSPLSLSSSLSSWLIAFPLRFFALFFKIVENFIYTFLFRCCAHLK